MYRADVVGSMLRPEQLKAARAAHMEGNISDAELKRLEDDAVDDAIAVQEQAGLDVVTDGEMRRFLFVGSLTEVVDGITPAPSATFHWYGDEPDDHITFENALCVTGKLSKRRDLAVEEYEYAIAKATKPVKVTLPSPMMLTNFWHPERSREAYDSLFDVFVDAAEILREEIGKLVALGCPYIQIDAPEVGVLVDERQHAFYRSQGVSPERALTDGIDLLNTLPDGSDTVFGFHLCRGNNEGRWMSAGGYEAISKRVFSRASNYDRFLLEYDSPRAGSLDAIADVPDDKVVVLGLVSTKRSELEPVDTLLGRIEQAASVFPREQLAVSTQCGFASSSLGNPISFDVQRQKLELVGELARRAWGSD
jgi:5-methyltetrahydropteroyltriglutamate--homocysteine methyltransferase